MNYFQTKYYKFSDLLEKQGLPGREGKIAHQYLTIYRKAKEKDNPVILELGTQRGLSTTVFLQVCMEKGGHLYSIDITDCSDITTNHHWTFIHADSSRVGPFSPSNLS